MILTYLSPEEYITLERKTKPDANTVRNEYIHGNDAYQTDFTEEDKVDIKTIHRKVRENEELRQVIEGDNTETNKRYEFDRVIDKILLGFVNSKLELFKKLSKSTNPEVNADLKRQLYQAYLEQSPSNLDST